MQNLSCRTCHCEARSAEAISCLMNRRPLVSQKIASPHWQETNPPLGEVQN